MVALAAICAGAPGLWANPILDPGGPGGLTLFSITNNNTFGLFDIVEGIAISGDNLLLSSGDATSLTQTIWSMPLVRSGGHITSVGTATVFQSVVNDGFLGHILSGGLITVNGGVLFTMLPNVLGQAVGAPGLIHLATVGNIGGLQYIPASQNDLSNAGKLKVSSSSGDWYTLSISGSPGSYTIGSVVRDPVGVQAFAFDYLPADATFAYPSVILGDASYISLYQLDGNGNPCIANTCQPVIHLVDAVDSAIGYGVVRDPVTGDVLFTTGDNQIFNLSDGFETPEPSTIRLALGGIALLAARSMGRRPTESDEDIPHPSRDR